MQKGEVSQTFAVNTTSTVKTSVSDAQTGEKATDAALSFMALLAPETTNNTTEEQDIETISKDIATLIDQKKVPEQMPSLGGFSLSIEMQDAYTAKLAGIDDATAKIRTKIKQIYSTLGLEYPEGSLSNSITNLGKILQNNFSIPPTYIANLNTINNWLVALEKVSKDSPSREEFKAKLPDNLIFK